MCGVTAWSTGSSALSGGLIVFLFLPLHFFNEIFFNLVFLFSLFMPYWLVDFLILIFFLFCLFVYITGVAKADMWSFHTHHFL